MIDEAAAVGFGRGADDYVAARPSYPSAVFDLLADELGLGPETDVLDLAAGTGKLTEDLVARGARVVAVEPVAAMRERLVALVPDIDGTARPKPFPSTTPASTWSRSARPSTGSTPRPPWPRSDGCCVRAVAWP